MIALMLLLAPMATQAGVSPTSPGERPPGVCRGLELRPQPKLDGSVITSGRYSVVLSRSSDLEVELVGSGGSGGGTSAGDRATWGEGGRAGSLTRTPLQGLSAGDYMLTIGTGGRSVTGRNWNGPTVHGRPGESTLLVRCATGFAVATAAGGAGGRGNGVSKRQYGDAERAGDGQELRDPQDNSLIARGGRGGQWQENGADVPPAYGAGGGGQGGTTQAGRKRSGSGGEGYARIRIVE